MLWGFAFTFDETMMRIRVSMTLAIVLNSTLQVL